MLLDAYQLELTFTAGLNSNSEDYSEKSIFFDRIRWIWMSSLPPPLILSLFFRCFSFFLLALFFFIPFPPTPDIHLSKLKISRYQIYFVKEATIQHFFEPNLKTTLGAAKSTRKHDFYILMKQKRWYHHWRELLHHRDCF